MRRRPGRDAPLGLPHLLNPHRLLPLGRTHRRTRRDTTRPRPALGLLPADAAHSYFLESWRRTSPASCRPCHQPREVPRDESGRRRRGRGSPRCRRTRVAAPSGDAAPHPSAGHPAALRESGRPHAFPELPRLLSAVCCLLSAVSCLLGGQEAHRRQGARPSFSRASSSGTAAHLSQVSRLPVNAGHTRPTYFSRRHGTAGPARRRHGGRRRADRRGQDPSPRGKETSTRRFFFRPSSLLLLAIGYCSP